MRFWRIHPPSPGYENLTRKETFERVADSEAQLRVLEKLRGFTVAAEKIVTEKGQGSFYLVVLDSVAKSVSIRPFGLTRLDEANAAYAEVEKRGQSGEPIEAVLVSAGPVEALKKAYPNYFLDTHEFIVQIEKVIAKARRTPVRSAKRTIRRAQVRRRSTDMGFGLGGKLRSMWLRDRRRRVQESQA